MNDVSRERAVGFISLSFVAAFLLTAGLSGYFGETTPRSEATPVKELNLSSLSWGLATSSVPFAPRDAHAVAEYKGRLWLIGGLNGEPARVRKGYIEYWRAQHMSDIWVSSDAKNWALSTAHAPWGGERSLELETFQGALWLFGGWSPVGGYHTYYWKTNDGLAWEKVHTTTAPSAREGAPVVAFHDKLWMFGGVNFDDRKSLNDVWSSVDGIAWEKATSTIPWSPRYDHAVTAFQGKLWLTGGVNLEGKIFEDTWVSSDGVTWERITTNNSVATARHGHTMLVWKDALWMFGGWTKPETGEGESWFSKDGSTWTKTSVGPWQQREDLTVTIFRDQPVLIGGMDTDWHWNNDVWIGDIDGEDQ